MIENPRIGDWVSYEDRANPYCEGTIQDRRCDQWLVIFEDETHDHFEWSDLRQHGWKLVAQTEEEHEEVLSELLTRKQDGDPDGIYRGYLRGLLT